MGDPRQVGRSVGERARQSSSTYGSPPSAGSNSGSLPHAPTRVGQQLSDYVELVIAGEDLQCPLPSGPLINGRHGCGSIPEGGYSSCLTSAIKQASFSAVPFTSYFAAF
jgi:hypothetical protein